MKQTRLPTRPVESLTSVSCSNIYLRQVKQYPLLTPAAEQELGRRTQAGDEQAYHQLVVSNLRLVVRIARRYRGVALHTLDLIQAGNIGLMRAASKFQPHKGFKFSTYASTWIRSSIERAIGQHGFTYQSYKMNQRVKHLLKVQEKLTHQLHRAPTYRELAEELMVTNQALDNTLRACILYSAEDYWSGSNGDTPAEPIDDTIDVEADVLHNVQAEQIQALLAKLPARQQQILKLRFGFDNDRCYNYSEIGRQLGLSAEMIRRTCLKTLRLLKQSEQWQACRSKIES